MLCQKKVVTLRHGYTFTTDSGNRYIISFIDYSTVIPGITCSQIFSFNIDRVDDGNHDNGSENKVRNTDIKKATASFFVNGIRTFAFLYYHANNIDADILAKGFKALADINFYNE